MVEEKRILSIPGERISAQTFLEAMQLTSNLDEKEQNRLDVMLDRASKVANPKAVFGVAPIEEKGKDYIVAAGEKLTSALLRKNLEKANRILPYVMTCGRELETWAKEFKDPTEIQWANSILLFYFGIIRRKLIDAVRMTYIPTGDISSMNPGSLPQWPLTDQKHIFALLGNVEDETGVILMESGLMKPDKSSSGFLFSAETHFENCAVCRRKDCPGRRASWRK